MNTLVCFALAFSLVAFAAVFYYIGRASAWVEASAMLDEVEVAFQKFMQEHRENL